MTPEEIIEFYEESIARQGGLTTPQCMDLLADNTITFQEWKNLCGMCQRAMKRAENVVSTRQRVRHCTYSPFK